MGKNDTPEERKARRAVNAEVRYGKRPHPNTLPCVDCGHVYAEGERRHEYDHTGDYNDQATWLTVDSVCTTCHRTRTESRASADALRGAITRSMGTAAARTPNRLEYMPLGAIAAAPRNVKDHDIGELITSIRRFGFNDAVIIDERTGRLVSGHGRVEALRAMWKAAPESLPPGIAGTEIEWQLPVQRGWSSKDDTEAEAFLVAANRIVELGGWDAENLERVLADLARVDALEGTGYDREDVDKLINEANAKRDGLTEPDDVPDVNDAGDVKAGDLFQLGDHLLLCGDSTKAEVVDRVIGADAGDLLLTDPPFGVSYESKAGKVHNDGAEGLELLLTAFYAQAFRVLKPGAFSYVFHAPGENALTFGLTSRAAGFRFKQGLVWVKDSMVLGHSDYHLEHEPIMYSLKPAPRGRRGRGGSGWYGDNSQTSVLRVAKPKRSEEHPTMKPVELLERLLHNSSAPGQVIFEPFSGSGSTIIACERLQRRCRAIELSPVYVNRTIARWETFTGRKVVKL